MLAESKKSARRRIVTGLILYFVALIGFPVFAYLATLDRRRDWSFLGYALLAIFLMGLIFFAWGCVAWSRGKGYRAMMGGALGVLGGLSPFLLLWGLMSLREYSNLGIAVLLSLGIVGCAAVALLAILPDRHKGS